MMEHLNSRFFLASSKSPFTTFSKILLAISCLITIVGQGKSNPLPIPTPTFPEAAAHQGQIGGVGIAAASPYYYNSGSANSRLQPNGSYTYSNRLSLGQQASSSSPTSSQLQEDADMQNQLVNPSELTFKLNRFCQADVSLERVICHHLRKRTDLPKKEKYFDAVQQAIFINISSNGDIRLEDFRSLFPNLIVLSITQSPLSAAILINLQSTGASSSGQWETRGSLLAPKSLLADPLFAKRLNGNHFNAFHKPTTTSVSRGGRALLHQHETNSDIDQEGVLNDDMANNKSHDAVIPSEETVIGQMEDSSNGNNTSNDSHETNDIPMSDGPSSSDSNNEETGERKDGGEMMPPTPQRLKRLVWPSVRHLNLSWNELTSDAVPDFLRNVFPNLEQLDLSNNFLTKLDKIRDADWSRLQSIDISGNPLDCTNLDWIDSPNIRLIHPNQTLCDQPPHQNKAKPIFKVLRLLKKVREECRVNCSCDIAYIWEQNHVVHSKTVVNCSGRGFLDFPNPKHLPHPTDTLDLRNNNITSMSTFVDDPRYLDLHVMNLHLDDNRISSINILEGSEWFYHFQVFSIRRNDLTEVPAYVLENVFRQNKRLLQIDLSSNNFKCDCGTVSSFKVWLLKYAHQIAHIDDVRCFSTNEQIRYMRMEEWCKVENHTTLLDVLDMVSIVLAILIVVVIAKVYYDYWNFKTKGKLPWIVSKM